MTDLSGQIPNLPPVIALGGPELFECVQNGASMRVTLAQIATYITGNTPILGTGYLLVNLPPAANYLPGTQAYCLDGLNPGQITGHGTGCPVFVQNDGLSNFWAAIWSGLQVVN